MAKQKLRRSQSAAPTPFEQARDEMFQHIMRCGVIGAAPDHQSEWFNDTMAYLEDRYHELSKDQLRELRVLGDRFCQPPKAKPVEAPVVDTTAAGDSFAAAYVAARLVGADPIEAARAGHRLAGIVVCHPGAIIPRAEMPLGLIPNHANSRKASP